MTQAIVVPDFRQMVADRFSLLTPTDWAILRSDPWLTDDPAIAVVFEQIYRPIYEALDRDCPDLPNWIDKQLTHTVYSYIAIQCPSIA